MIEVITGDITTLKVDVVVNAANSQLAGGGGVDGAIHRAAGERELHAACRVLGGCPCGEVRVTAGFALPAQVIYHTVGPVWAGGDHNEAELLGLCYERCVQLADSQGFHTIAFPAISCGVYGYPKQQAVKVAVATVREALKSAQNLSLVIFCCFDETMAARYRQALTER